MNIMHVTCLSNNKASGVAGIVPYHIHWQSQQANVFWLNVSVDYVPPKGMNSNYHNLNDLGSMDIHLLSTKPDIVVFHGIYFYKYCQMAVQLNRMNVPYIVVPHGSLTGESIRKKFIKKRIAFMLIFNEFLRNARAIQYLTQGEYEASGDKWNKNHIIVPNGCEIPPVKKDSFRRSDVVGTFIGRKSIYYKGLDLLILACNEIKPYLKETNCTINIYGPDVDGSNKQLTRLIKKYGLQHNIILHDSVFGEAKERILLDSDFFVLTSRTEGHPVALLEALSYGLPCLVTSGTNMSEEILGYNAGWASQADLLSIAESFVKMLSDIPGFSIIGDNARRLSLNYDWASVAKSAINAYEELSR